jgi:putative transposase
MSVQMRLEQARYAVSRGVTQRRACTLMNVVRSGLVYQCKADYGQTRNRSHARLLGAVPQVWSKAGEDLFAPRWHYVGTRSGGKRIRAAAGLQVPSKKSKKRYRSQNCKPFVATAPNQIWAYDFLFDGCPMVLRSGHGPEFVSVFAAMSC